MLDDDKKRYKMKDGGPGIEALSKEAPEVVERMGFQEGGGDILDKRLKAMVAEESNITDLKWHSVCLTKPFIGVRLCSHRRELLFALL